MARRRPGSVTAKTAIRSATLPWLMNRLVPSMHVVVAVADGAGPRGRRVGAGLGLGQGEGDELLAAGELREPAGLLLGRAGDADRQRAELLDGEDQPGRRAGAAQLLDREADAEQVAAEAAVLLGERQRQDVLLREAARRRSSGNSAVRSISAAAGRRARRRARGRRRGAAAAPRSGGMARWWGSRWSPAASYRALHRVVGSPLDAIRCGHANRRPGAGERPRGDRGWTRRTCSCR